MRRGEVCLKINKCPLKWTAQKNKYFLIIYNNLNQKKMSNVNEINTQNLTQLKTDLSFQTDSKYLIIKSLTAENVELLQKSWEKTKEQNCEVLQSYNYFKSEKYKDIAKKFNVTLTTETYAKLFGMSKSNFLECVQCAKVDANNIVKYEKNCIAENIGLSRKGLLKFVADLNKPSTQVDTSKDNDTDTDTDTDTAIITKKLSIKIDKNDKISVDGKATLKQLTLIMEEVKRLMEEAKVKEEKK